ncbi:MAG: glutamate-5-semialdehyde dehydrogenase [Salinivirgaceae bacterium]
MDCTPIFQEVSKASISLNRLSNQEIADVLMHVAKAAEEQCDFILSENAEDLKKMASTDPKYDRLKLTEKRIGELTSDIRNVAGLPSPLGKIWDETIRPNGLNIKKVTVPFGVIGIIYEARPNVTFDVFSLCIKSGNACILKGGSDAIHSNTAIVKVIHEVLVQFGINKNILALLPAGRSETEQLLKAHGFVDLLIPRGSQELIQFVRENASIPVIETGAGICHTYFDESGDVEKGRLIIHNAKTRRVSVCNALDCLLVHESRLNDLWYLVDLCSQSEVELFADDKARQALQGKYPANLIHAASPDSYGTEFLSYKMAIKTVSSINEAIAHIAKYSSKHSEAIISEKKEEIQLFQKMVDAATVYANTSTAFTDGSQFGLGAEIGISTQKLHARGPMALAELTSYKWIIEGNGQIRP